ncbi:MAG: aminotransferase class I/II-fold pyridoxal phosphate-dependent enzyme [Labilithrix sp.]|nr:aminotransferase class I/II-fold pyridoxal phosphate-dependent enzyme [Labilithrix sp.]
MPTSTSSRSLELDRIATIAVRAGQPRQDAFDAVTTPIACTATYAFSSSAELRDHFEGRITRDEYGRYGNPTVRAAEQKLAALDAPRATAGSTDAVLFGSGMAAITSALFALLKQGDHVILPGEGYRRTRAFVTNLLARFGVTSTVVPAGDAEALARAIEPRTRAILTESPTNPYLRVVDLPALAALKRRHPRVKLLVDATFATPVNQRPLEHGADLVIHSCTKYLGGHNDLLAGVVVGDEALVSLIREARDVLGGVLDPHAAYLLLRGLKTLPLRVERQNVTALGIARWLETQPGVERVYYPGLASHPDHEVAKRVLSGAGGVVSFVLRADLDTTARALDACRLATIAPSLGGVETLIEQVALMSYYGLAPEERAAIGIADGLVRLSVGLEDPADIRDDLARVLEVVRSASKRAAAGADVDAGADAVARDAVARESATKAGSATKEARHAV